MEPSSDAWTAAVENSQEGLAIILMAVIAVLFVLVKWCMPMLKELRIKRLEIERYRIEVEEKAAAALDDRERERIKTTQRQIEQQEASTRAIEALSLNMATISAQLDDSKANSSKMGVRSETIDTTTKRIESTQLEMKDKVDEIHNAVCGR